MGRSEDADEEQGLDTGIREPELTTFDGYTDLPTEGVDAPGYRAAVLGERAPEVQTSIAVAKAGATYNASDRYVWIDSLGAPDADPRWRKQDEGAEFGVTTWTRPMDEYDDEAISILEEQRQAEQYERRDITLDISASRRQHYEQLLRDGLSDHEARAEAYGDEAIPDGTDLRDLPAGLYVEPGEDQGRLLLGWDAERHLITPDGKDPIPWEVRDRAERVLEELAMKPELRELLASAERKLREAPDGAEGDLAGPGTVDEGGLASIAEAMSAGPISNEAIAELFKGRPDGAAAAARALAGGMTRPVFSSKDVVEADELGVGIAVTGEGDVGVAITLYAEGETPMVRLLDPYRVLKLISALSQATTQALDQQRPAEEEADVTPGPSTAEKLDTEE